MIIIKVFVIGNKNENNNNISNKSLKTKAIKKNIFKDFFFSGKTRERRKCWGINLYGSYFFTWWEKALPDLLIHTQQKKAHPTRKL